MLIDIRTLHQAQIDTDICIVGSGPAGMSLAREFLGQNINVAVLESGDIEFGYQTQLLAHGETFGHAMMPIDVCNRQVGGNSNVWSIKIRPDQFGVRYVPFDEIDFEKRDWIAHSGWPFSRDHLMPYYERAQAICQIGPFAYEGNLWGGENRSSLPVDLAQLETGMFQFGPARAFYQQYRDELKAASNVTLYTHATAVEIRTNEVGRQATHIRVATFARQSIEISAKCFVLACGGFQNARLLLASNEQQPSGIGNHHDVVGRYYHDHPQAMGGYFTPYSRQLFNRTALYDLRSINGVPVMGFLRLSRSQLEQERLLNVNAILFPRPKPRQSEAIASFKFLAEALLGHQQKTLAPSSTPPKTGLAKLADRIPEHALHHAWKSLTGIDSIAWSVYLAKTRQQSLLPNLGRGGWSELADNSRRFQRFEVMHLFEQSPDPQNRITLSRQRDALGCLQPELHWRWSQEDADRSAQSLRLMAAELKRAGLGEFCLDLDEVGHPKIGRPTGSAHLMGTTRIHDDPKQGVVDANCRVHGIQNLFVTGSSTFPTGGYANPTLTIVAMALRLGDLLKQELASPSRVSMPV